MKEEYYSNCLIEALKAKIKWGKQVKIIYIPSWKNEVFCPHFMWHDLTNDTIKDFHAEYGYVEKWYNLFWFKGHIRCRPYSVYERWLKTHSWHESEDKE
jgi:hypothetical protein